MANIMISYYKNGYISVDGTIQDLVDLLQDEGIEESKIIEVLEENNVIYE